MKWKSHYDWLNKYLKTFFDDLGIDWVECSGIIVAHGDKCYGYKRKWESNNIPFEHGVALYLLTYVTPFDTESRETKSGWIHPADWVVTNYPKYREQLTNYESSRNPSTRSSI